MMMLLKPEQSIWELLYRLDFFASSRERNLRFNRETIPIRSNFVLEIQVQDRDSTKLERLGFPQ